jgi:hypothetical protein
MAVFADAPWVVIFKCLPSGTASALYAYSAEIGQPFRIIPPTIPVIPTGVERSDTVPASETDALSRPTAG